MKKNEKLEFFYLIFIYFVEDLIFYAVKLWSNGHK